MKRHGPPEDATLGTFEMMIESHKGWFSEAVPAYLIGPFAIHHGGPGWDISHAATGLKIVQAHCRTLSEACEVARVLCGVPGWDKLKRGKVPERPSGMTPEFKEAVRAALRTFPRIRAAMDEAA